MRVAGHGGKTGEMLERQHHRLTMESEARRQVLGIELRFLGDDVFLLCRAYGAWRTAPASDTS
jgi:hypothetical protein